MNFGENKQRGSHASGVSVYKLRLKSSNVYVKAQNKCKPTSVVVYCHFCGLNTANLSDLVSFSC